jgi:DHA2 family multidrug resistance protein
MIVMGKIANRYDARVLIGIGALMTAGTGFLLMGLNPDTSANTLYWPLILRSIGSVVMFMPLSLATLGPLPKNEIAAGSGFYSLTRMLGSSIGIALITTMLARREATHRSVLVERVTDFRDPALERIDQLSSGFAGADPAVAQQQAYHLIDRAINGQAALLAYSDIFFYVAMAFVISLPLLLLLGSGKGGKAKEAAESAH